MREFREYGTPCLVHVAVVVGPGEMAAKESIRYLEGLPDTTQVYAHGDKLMRRELRGIAKRRKIPFRSCNTAPEAVRMAQLVVIFGESPFGSGDVEKLESQGVPVEVVNPKKKGKKRGSKAH